MASDNTLVDMTLMDQTLPGVDIVDHTLAMQVTQSHNRPRAVALSEVKQLTALCIILDVKATGSHEIHHEVIDALHRDQKSQCVDIAVRFGAFHVGTIGNTLLFYFGYPTASDSDYRLCARTALEVISTLNKRNVLLRQTHGVEVLSGMGMHTGMVTTYADATPEGETTNIAMELARVASANQVLTTGVNQRLLDTYLEFQPQPERPVGIANRSLALHALIGERQAEAFGFLRARKNHFELVGREQQLATLQTIITRRLSETDVTHAVPYSW